jgi:DNA repair protein RadC
MARRRGEGIHRWPEAERPRERLFQRGPEELSEAQLLAILLGTGRRGRSAVEVAHELLRAVGGLRGLDGASVAALAKRRLGVGPAKLAQIKAGLELGRRVLRRELEPGFDVTSSKAAYEYLRPAMRDLPREIFKVLFLNATNRILGEMDTKGSVTESAVYLREIYAQALQRGAASILCAHNHPSGNPRASAADRQLTEELVIAGQAMRVPLLDHLIVGEATYYSFADEGLLAQYEATQVQRRRATSKQ